MTAPAVFITLVSPAGAAAPDQVGGLLAERTSDGQRWFTGHFFVSTPLAYLPHFGHACDAAVQRYLAGDRAGWQAGDGGRETFLMSLGEVIGEIPSRVPADWED